MAPLTLERVGGSAPMSYVDSRAGSRGYRCPQGAPITSGWVRRYPEHNREADTMGGHINMSMGDVITLFILVVFVVFGLVAIGLALQD
jgi:hypothetical protein